MDNRIFNVNGEGEEMLRDALRLAFQQEGPKTTAKGYIIDPKKGMILLWHAEKANPFPSPLSADAATSIVWEWLKTEPKTECEGWDRDHQHDGSNSLGWRVYCEDWGHVTIGEPHSSHAASHYAIVAIKPAYLWHGK